MTNSIGDSRNVNLAELLGDGEELLAAATIAVTADGEYSMHIADVDGAPVTMTPAQKAHALRMLATAVEAEAIFSGLEADDVDNPAAEPATPQLPIGYGLLVTIPDTKAVYLEQDSDGDYTVPFESPEKAIAWLEAQPGEHNPEAVVSTVAIVPLKQIQWGADHE